LRLTFVSTMRLSKRFENQLIENLEEEINNFFTEAELNQLAREAQFIQRENKITGSVFLRQVVFKSKKLKKYSLNDLAIDIKKDHQINITKQALNERFNDKAVDFLKTIFSKTIRQQLNNQQIVSEVSTIKGFNRILIKDSVCFQIHQSMAEYYPGSGGSGSKAAVRIQFEYDLLSGEVNDLSLGAFNEQDATNSFETIELTRQGDLIIRDLAYMNLQVLKKIINIIKATFVSRLSPTMKIYELINDEYEELNFVKIKNHMEKYRLPVIEKNAYLGSQDKLAVRLIIHLMPAEEVAKRLRNAKKNNNKKGRGQLTKEYKARAALNLFITNATVDQIPTSMVWKLYQLRWQIELIFKIWKSIAKIDKVKKVKKERLECYIYGRLIFIALGWKILWAIAKRMYRREKKALSFYKAFKTLLRNEVDTLYNIFTKRTRSRDDFFIEFYKLSCENHLLEKKKQKHTSLEILILFVN